MKKICFVTTVHGTLQSFVLVTAKELFEMGEYDITFVCNPNDDFERNLPHYIKFIPVKMRRGIDVFGLVSTFKMYKIFKKCGFDLVQYATPNASLYASIASKIAGVKVRLYGQWGLRYVTLTGAKRKIFKLIEKLVCNISTDIQVTSKKNKDFAFKEGLFPIEKAYLVGEGGSTGINLKHYDIENKSSYALDVKESLGIADEFVFGFVGRFSVDKGANELLRAFKEFNRMFKSKLLIIGVEEQPENIDKELYDWAIKTSDVFFTGRIDNSVLKKYYSSMDVYLHPSYREGYSKVIQEAAAMGVPIITTNIPGASEVMEPEISCILVEPKNSEDLFEKMKYVYMNVPIRESLGAAARKRILDEFDQKVKLKQQIEIYGELLR